MMNRRKNERRSVERAMVKEEERPVYLRRPGISILVQIFEGNAVESNIVSILPRGSYELFTVRSQMWPGIPASFPT